jgi:GNAT superfamily N-acetyltransferase
MQLPTTIGAGPAFGQAQDGAVDWGFVAEDADAYQELPASVERQARSDVVLVHWPSGDTWSNLAIRVRFAEDGIARSVAAVRAWFGGKAADEFRWLIGPSATPARIVDSLIALGARRDEAEPTLTAMVLDREPPAVQGVQVRQVRSIADFADMERIRREVFNQTMASDHELAAGFAAHSTIGGPSGFLAELDGEAVAYGVMRRTDRGPFLLAGGVTLPRARGRGAYRALVRARWDAAKAMGSPALVTQAQAASRPILLRLGFRATGSIEVLVDRAAVDVEGHSD